MLKTFTIIMIIFGCIVILLSLFLDKLGYGDSGSFGIGQFLLTLVGITLILIGILRKKFTHFYRNIAIILLNTFVFLCAVELGAIIIGKQLFFVRHFGIQQLTYYADQDWTQTYWKEAQLAQGIRYKPYVVWRHLPFFGTHINMNQDGLRLTPGSSCDIDSYRIFTFGGSTMLGWGSPDWGTIPAYLRKDLETVIERPICIMNFGEDGYVSTQNVIALLLQLQAGNVPHIVIFYDGINEVIAAHESGRPSAHVTLANIASRFEQQEHVLVTWAKSTRTYILIKSLIDKLHEIRGKRSDFSQDQDGEDDTYHLAKSVVSIYLNNYKIVSILAREYNFDYFFFIQPHLSAGKKSLTEEEKGIRLSMNSDLVNLAKMIYRNIEYASPNYNNLYYIADIFEKENKSMYFDTVGHITPEGNRLVAQEITGIIKKSLYVK